MEAAQEEDLEADPQNLKQTDLTLRRLLKKKVQKRLPKMEMQKRLPKMRRQTLPLREEVQNWNRRKEARSQARVQIPRSRKRAVQKARRRTESQIPLRIRAARQQILTMEKRKQMEADPQKAIREILQSQVRASLIKQKAVTTAVKINQIPKARITASRNLPEAEVMTAQIKLQRPLPFPAIWFRE